MDFRFQGKSLQGYHWVFCCFSNEAEFDPFVAPRTERCSVSHTVIPQRPRKSFPEQLVMWARGLITKQWRPMAEKVLKTAGVWQLNVHY